MSELFSLFFISFLAATILPAQSEIALAALISSSEQNTYLLVIAASLGNILGALANYYIGYYAVHFKNKKWFPVKGKSLKTATKFYNKWGIWSLLLAWTPFIGDPLTVVAGIFKTNIWLFLLLVSVGKIGRYLAIALLI